MTVEVARFEVIDYIILVLMLAISAAIGLYYSFAVPAARTGDTKELFLAGRSLTLLPVMMSNAASFVSGADTSTLKQLLFILFLKILLKAFIDSHSNHFYLILTFLYYLSGVTLLGIPSEVYTYGGVYMWSCVAYFFSLPLVTFFFFPKYYHLNITSANEVWKLEFARIR